jgi:hypothetical protein
VERITGLLRDLEKEKNIMIAVPPKRCSWFAGTFGALCLLSVIAVGPVLALNLLENGDAETGSITGWTRSGSQVQAVMSQEQQAGTVYPYEGTYFFTFAANLGLAAEMWQSDTTGLTPGYTLALTGWVSTEDMDADDWGMATINIYDGDSQLIGTASSPVLTTLSNIWDPFEVTLAVPSGAASWEVVMSGTREYGNYINVFWDALTLTSGLAGVGKDWRLPKAFHLEEARPNPFNTTTTLGYALPSPSKVEIAVFSIEGRRIRQLISGVVPAGTYRVTWDGRDHGGQQVASGIYFCRMEAGSYCRTIRMALVK